MQLTAEVLGVLWIGLHAKLLDTVNMHPTKEALTALSVCYVGQHRQLARQLTVMEGHSGEARAYRGAYRVRVAIKRAH